MTSPPVIDSRLLIAGEKGVHSGIPEAVFLEDVDAFMKGGESAEEILKKLDEQHQKFKFMLSNFDSKKKRLKAQVPDISTTLESVKVCVFWRIFFIASFREEVVVLRGDLNFVSERHLVRPCNSTIPPFPLFTHPTCVFLALFLHPIHSISPFSSSLYTTHFRISGPLSFNVPRPRTYSSI